MGEERAGSSGDQMQGPVMLVGLAHPEATGGLIELAIRISHGEGYQIVAVHVVEVPPQANLGTVRGSPEMIEARQGLLSAIRQAAAEDVAVKGVVEIARDVVAGLVSASETQEASLILVGYSDPANQDEDEEGRGFDRTMHHLARATQVDLVVAKLRRTESGSILLLIDTGMNLSLSGMLARNISRSSGADVSLVHLLREDEDEDLTRDRLNERLAEEGLDDLGEVLIETSDDDVTPLESMIALANRHDITILGASPRPSIAESIFGGDAERIAREADCNVLVVRAGSAVGAAATD